MQDQLDPQAIDARRAKRSEAADLHRNEEDAALREVLATFAGRKVLFKLLAEGGVYRTSFAADPYQTAFNEGRRSHALRLLGDVTRVAPEQYRVMQEENSNG